MFSSEDGEVENQQSWLLYGNSIRGSTPSLRWSAKRRRFFPSEFLSRQDSHRSIIFLILSRKRKSFGPRWMGHLPVSVAVPQFPQTSKCVWSIRRSCLNEWHMTNMTHQRLPAVSYSSLM